MDITSIAPDNRLYTGISTMHCLFILDRLQRAHVNHYIKIITSQHHTPSQRKASCITH